MKRFQETCKWDESWFWELSPTSKLLWFFLNEHCNAAGFIEVSLRIASTKIGCTVKKEHLAELASRLKPLSNGKVYILGFLRLQYGNLSRECKPHSAAFAILDEHSLTIDDLEQPSRNLSDTSQVGFSNLQEKEEVQVKVQDKVQDKKEDEGAGEGDRVKRLNALFNRRAGTKWSDKETRAYRSVAELCPIEDFELVEFYYRSGSQFIRRDLQTLLNNWNGEIDRARAWLKNPKQNGAPAPTPQRKVLNIPTL